jgi:Rieske Fe-S protein
MAGAPADMTTSTCKPGTISAGAASGYTVGGTPKLFKTSLAQLYVVRDSGGLFAVDAICPHAGCTNNYKSGKFVCPCHSATFALDGSAPTSPAHTPLGHYAMCVDASGNVTVDPNTSVATSIRY